jgi:hypothetical protein
MMVVVNCKIQITETKGLISVDRRTSLLSHLQYPVSIQVVYKGFNALGALGAFKCGVGPCGLSLRDVTLRADISSLSSIDSDLEAFSHYPADGSFGALAGQPTP